MRHLLSVLASLVAGFAAGLFLFHGSSSARPSGAEPGEAPVAERHPLPAAPVAPPEKPEARVGRLVEAARRREESLENQDALYLAIQALGRDDFSHLFAQSQMLQKMFAQPGRDGIRNRAALTLLLRRWLEVDEAAAMNWLPRVAGVFKDQGSRRFVASTFAELRPEQMLAAASRWPAERKEIVEAALEALAARQPARAQAWLANVTDPQERAAAEKAIRRGQVQGDPLRTLEIAGALSDHAEAFALVAQGLEKARESGPGFARQLALQPAPDWLIPAILPQIDVEHPRQTLELAARCQNSGADMKVTGSVARAFSALASQDREAARRLLEDFTGSFRAAAVSGYAEGWARDEPEAALAWLSTLPAAERTSPGRSYANTSDMLDLAFHDWMERDPAQARAWTEQLPSGDLRQRMLGRLAQSYARGDDPAQGLRILTSTGAEADGKTARHLARAWAAKDGGAAANWAVAEAAPPVQEQILPMIVQTWSEQDENAVADWIAGFPAGRMRDRCITEYLQRSTLLSAGAQEVVDEFDAWFPTMTDPQLRADLAVGHLFFRKKVDAAAEAWLASLPNVDQQVIHKALQSKNR